MSLFDLFGCDEEDYLQPIQQDQNQDQDQESGYQSSSTSILKDDESGHSYRAYHPRLPSSSLRDTQPTTTGRKRIVRPELPVDKQFLRDVDESIAGVIGRNVSSEYKPHVPTFIKCKWSKNFERNMSKMISALQYPDTYAAFHVFSQTVIFKGTMIPGTTKFNGFRINELNGKCEDLALKFGAMLFCDPRNGENDCGDHTSYTFRVGDRDIPKVMVYMEPLVKSCESDSPVVLFANGNVVGYRVWYVCLDPMFNPIKAIDDLITNQKHASGACTSYKLYSADEPPFSDELRPLEPGSQAYNSTMAELERANKKLIDLQRDLSMAKVNYNAEFDRGSHRPSFSIQTISSRSVYYQMIQHYLMRCIDCEMHTTSTCDECRYKDTNITHFRRPETLGPNGNALSVEDMVRNIRFAPLRSSTMTEVIMNSMDDNEPWLKYMALSPDFGYSGEISSRRVQMLDRAEVCKEQSTAENYLAELQHSDDSQVIFFTPSLLFRIDPAVFGDIDVFFENAEFPWIFNSSDIMLDVAEKQTYAQANERQTEYIKRRCRGLGNTQCLDAAVARSDAFVDFFEDNTNSRFFKSKPLLKTSFPKAKYVIPDPDAIAKATARTEQLRDDSTVYFDAMRERLKRLESIRTLISLDTRHYIQNAIREEGVIAFNAMFNSTNPNITQIQRNAAKLIEDACSAGPSGAFKDIHTVDVDIGFDGSCIISLLMYFGYLGNDIIDNHIVPFNILLATYRANHPNNLEDLIKAPNVLPNIVVQGTAGTGKSNILHVIDNITVNNTVSQVSSHSLRANAIAGKYHGMVFASDELNAQNDAFMASLSGNTSLITILKEAMTRFVTNHKVLTIDDDSNRYQRDIVTLWHCVHVLLANNWRTTPGEASFYQRFDFFYMLANQPIFTFEAVAEMAGGFRYNYKNPPSSSSGSTPKKIKSASVTANSLPTKACGLDDIAPTNVTQLTAWQLMAHALHIMACAAMEFGALPYPNMALLGVYYNVVERAMLKKFPSFTDTSRRLTRIYSYAIALTIHRAICMVWTSELSPLLKYDSVRSKTNPNELDHSITMQTMSKSTIMMIAPYLQVTESICIFAITNTILQQIYPSKAWQMVYRIAKKWCGYGTTPNYAKIDSYSEEQEEDRNYLRTAYSYDKILTWANQEGCNEYTLTEMLTALERVDICVERAVIGGRIVTNRKMKAIRIIGRDAVTEKVSIPVQSSTSMPLQIPKGARVDILVELVSKWSPRHIADYVVKSMGHKHTRPRKVVLGDTIPGFPQFFGVTELKANPNRIIKQTTQTLENTFMANHLAPEYSVSHATSSLNESISATAKASISYEEDIEAAVLLPWLRKNRHLFMGVPLEDSKDIPDEHLLQFLPAVYDGMIKDLRYNSPVYNRCDEPPNNYPSKAVPNELFHPLMHPGHPYFGIFNDEPEHLTANKAPPPTPDQQHQYPHQQHQQEDLTSDRYTNVTTSMYKGGTIRMPSNAIHNMTRTPASFGKFSV